MLRIDDSSRPRAQLALVIAVLTVLAVSGFLLRDRAAPVLATCDDLPGWRPERVSGGVLALCLPPDYVPVASSSSWTRLPSVPAPASRTVAPFRGSDFLNIRVVPAVEVLSGDGPWPPSLLRPQVEPCHHCQQIAALTARWDTLANGTIIRIELARVTDGFRGVRDAYAFMAAWPLPRGRWVFAHGWTATEVERGRLIRSLGTAVVH